ncbi:MAG: FAD-dependent oxidoreductase [Bacteroidia bacterium]|nr:FAD-dependent oxidoreductase [Bacteroidia bacterium]
MNGERYLVVGRGLAGTVVGCRLFQEGIDFRVADDPSLSSCSRIAGGIVNPVVLKRLALPQQAGDMLQKAREFYLWCESQFGKTFYNPTPLVKIFGDQRDRAFWEEKRVSELQGFAEEACLRTEHDSGIRTPFGYARVLSGGILDMRGLIECAGEQWRQAGILLECPFRHEEMELISGGVRWKGEEYSGVIFCEGHKGFLNPWFTEAGFAPVKGEILTVHIPGLNLNEVINKGVYIIPKGKDVYKVGATFSWHRLDDEPEEKAKEELLEKLRYLVTREFTVLKHEAGVRPAAVGRTPMLGSHPAHSQLHIFNGLGTKGALISPYYSELFLKYLRGVATLPGETDVRRFF